MKAKLLRILPVALILAVLITAMLPLYSVLAVTRDLHWIGGTGSWSDTAHWSLAEGGAGGEAVPDTDDNVFIDSGSDTGSAFTLTVNATAYCLDIDWADTDVTPTWTGSSALNIYGSMTLKTGMVRSYTGAITFKATTSETLTFSGTTTNSSITFDGVGGTWTVQDAWNAGAGEFTLTNGAIDFNDQNITTTHRLYTTGSNTRGLDLGNGTISFGGWYIGSTTNLTFSAGTSSIIQTGATYSFTGGGLTYYNLTMTAEDVEVVDTNTFHNFTKSAFNSLNDTLTFRDDQTITNLLTLNGYSASKRLLVWPHYATDDDSASTLTVNGSITATNVDFLGITISPAVDLSAITGGCGDLGDNAGITFTTPNNHYWVGNSDNWSSINAWASTTGGAGGYGMPLPQDTAIFDSSSFSIASRTVTVDVPYIGKVNSTEVTNLPAIYSAGTINMYGDLILGSHTWNTVTGTYIYDRTLPFINCGSSTITGNLYIYAYDTTCTLSNNLTLTGTLYHRAGTLDTWTYSITAGYFDSSTTTYTRVLSLGTGTHTFNGTAATDKWKVSATNLTLSTNTATIVLTNSTANTQTFTGGTGITTYNILRIEGSGNYQTTFASSNTYNKVIIDRSVASKTIAGNYTLTCTIGFYVPLAGVRVVTITNVDFSKASGVVTSDYLTISGSSAGGGATYYAGSHSTDSGGNAGWIFGDLAVPAITTIDATVITGTGATLNATVTSIGGYSTIDVGFEYGKTVSYGTYTAFQTGITGIGAVTGRRITALESSTTYHFRAIVRYNEADYVYGADETFTTLVSSSGSATTGVPLVTTVPPDIPNMYVEGETGGLFGLEDFVNPALTTAGIPEALFWYSIAFLVAIVLGFVTFGFTRQLIIQAIVSAIAMAFFCGGGVLGDGLIPYWTVLIFIIEAIMLVVIQERVHV